MDLDAVRKKLQNLQSKTTRQNNLWKPEAGTQVIRIVPYKFNQEYPFIELYFHYGLAGKNYLSPTTYGNPDPVQEFADKLKATNDKDDYQLARKLDATMRTYVPIIVRGQESEGVKFWGFGKTVYAELLAVIDDPDYGDISDPVTGRDITVEFTPGGEGTFAKTAIRVKPNQTPISEDKAVLDLVSNQQDIKNIFKEPSYDDLNEALKAWLNPESTEDESSNEASPEANTTENDLDTKTVSDPGQAFDALFNK